MALKIIFNYLFVRKRGTYFCPKA